MVGKIEMSSKPSGKLRQICGKSCVVLGQSYESRCYNLETLCARTIPLHQTAYALTQEQAIAQLGNLR